MEGENQEETLDAIKRVIDACTFGKLDIESLATFSIEYIFLKLRAKSKGEIVKLKHICPECEHENAIEINIDKIQCDFTEGHDKKIALEGGIGVVMKYPELSIVNKVQDDEKNIDSIFNVIVDCIDYIYDSENTYKMKDVGREEMNKFIESMNDEQFEKIQEFFNTMPKLRKEIAYDCGNSECDNKEPIVLEGLDSFLE